MYGGRILRQSFVFGRNEYLILRCHLLYIRCNFCVNLHFHLGVLDENVSGHLFRHMLLLSLSRCQHTARAVASPRCDHGRQHASKGLPWNV